ncbi:MAG TPA: hypothetical protein VK943_01120, partial [Arenibaculum sp.]|nr:hypothetical protein [Arenibaculum sp.]
MRILVAAPEAVRADLLDSLTAVRPGATIVVCGLSGIEAHAGAVEPDLIVLSAPAGAPCVALAATLRALPRMAGIPVMVI